MKLNLAAKILKELEKKLNDLELEYLYDNQYNLYMKIRDCLILIILIEKEDEKNVDVLPEYSYDSKLYISNEKISNSFTLEIFDKIKKLKEKINNNDFFESILISFFRGNIEEFLNLILNKYESDNKFQSDNANFNENEKKEVKSKEKENLIYIKYKKIEKYFNKKFYNEGNYFYSLDGTTVVHVMNSINYNVEKVNYMYNYTTHMQRKLKKLRNSKQIYIYLFFEDKKDGIFVKINFLENLWYRLDEIVPEELISWQIIIKERNGKYYLIFKNRIIKLED